MLLLAVGKLFVVKLLFAVRKLVVSMRVLVLNAHSLLAEMKYYLPAHSLSFECPPASDTSWSKMPTAESVRPNIANFRANPGFSNCSGIVIRVWRLGTLFDEVRGHLVGEDGDGGSDESLGVFQDPVSHASGVEERLVMGLKVFVAVGLDNNVN